MNIHKSIFFNLKDVYKKKDLIVFMIKSHKGAFFFKSFLGQSWYLLESIFNIFVYYLLICVIYKNNSNVNIFLIIIIGISHYDLFQSSINNTITTFSSREYILKQIPINPLVLFFVSFFASLRKSLIFCFLVVIPIFLYNMYGHTNLAVHAIIYIGNLLLLILLSFSTALIFTVWYVYFRDCSKLIPLALRILMYFSPVLFSLASIENQKLRFLILLNPLTSIFSGFQRALLVDNNIYDYKLIYWPFILSIILLYFSFYIFEQNKTKIIKNL